MLFRLHFLQLENKITSYCQINCCWSHAEWLLMELKCVRPQRQTDEIAGSLVDLDQ